MKYIIIVISTIVAVTAAGTVHAQSSSLSGERLFVEHCSRCHPSGGNSINPEKNLRKNNLEKNNLHTESAIVQYLLNPGPGMPRLIHREKGLSEEQAAVIARYILAGFPKQSQTPSNKSGEVLFYEFCSRCHPNGGNVVNPQKNLQAQTLTAAGLKTEDQLVAYLLNPGPGMPRLIHRDHELSETSARKIIRYIMQTFK
jgi:cytochrome c6